jgi:integrase
VEARLIAQSPCRSIRLPRIPRTEQRFLTAEQIERLADAIADEYQALVYAAAYLGCRWGELVGLKRENLNLLKREVAIIGTMEEVGGELRYHEETKTSSSRRSLTVPLFLAAILARHLESAPITPFLFTGRDGALLRRSNFRRRHFKPALRRAGLESAVRFHDLRHTCAALLIAQSAHPKEIQARLGHASITTTLDLYGHLMPSLGAQLDTALDKARDEARANLPRPDRGLQTSGWR